MRQSAIGFIIMIYYFPVHRVRYKRVVVTNYDFLNETPPFLRPLSDILKNMFETLEIYLIFPRKTAIFNLQKPAGNFIQRQYKNVFNFYKKNRKFTINGDVKNYFWFLTHI